jgi:hypothetical protein
MRPSVSLVRHAGFGLWMVLALACGSKGGDHATREDCTKVSEHIADLIVNEAKANPDALWDVLHEGSGDSGIPADVTKPVFKLWLDSTQGQTWMMQRRGQTLSGTQQAIESCVKNATSAQVKCLLGSKTKLDVEACDRARAPATGSAAPAAPAGSAESTPTGSAGSAS